MSSNRKIARTEKKNVLRRPVQILHLRFFNPETESVSNLGGFTLAFAATKLVEPTSGTAVHGIFEVNYAYTECSPRANFFRATGVNVASNRLHNSAPDWTDAFVINLNEDFPGKAFTVFEVDGNGTVDFRASELDLRKLVLHHFLENTLSLIFPEAELEEFLLERGKLTYLSTEVNEVLEDSLYADVLADDDVAYKARTHVSAIQEAVGKASTGPQTVEALQAALQVCYAASTSAAAVLDAYLSSHSGSGEGDVDCDDEDGDVDEGPGPCDFDCGAHCNSIQLPDTGEVNNDNDTKDAMLDASFDKA